METAAVDDVTSMKWDCISGWGSCGGQHFINDDSRGRWPSSYYGGGDIWTGKRRRNKHGGDVFYGSRSGWVSGCLVIIVGEVAVVNYVAGVTWVQYCMICLKPKHFIASLCCQLQRMLIIHQVEFHLQILVCSYFYFRTAFWKKMSFSSKMYFWKIHVEKCTNHERTN